MSQYVYLFHTRELFNSNQPIYKIGKTTKPNFTRFSNYPKGSVMLFQSACLNCHELEKEIIKLFTSKYVRKTYFGREYFEGNQRSMIGDLCDIVKNEGVIQNVIVSTVIDEEIIQDIIVEETVQDVIVSNVLKEETIQDVIVEETIDVIVSNVLEEDTIQDVIVEETIVDVIVEETIVDVIVSNVVVEETIQDVIVEETIQDVIVEEIIQDIIVEENDTSNDMRAVQCVFVSNIIEEEEEEEEGNVTKKHSGKAFSCDQCQYSTDIKSSFKTHLKSIKHVLYLQVREKDDKCKHQCKVCNKKYLSQPGLWAHNQTCKPPVVAAIQAPPVVDLHARFDYLERIMMEMAKNLVS